MTKNIETAAICGLFCESCSLYIGTTQDPQRLEFLASKYNKPIEEMKCTGCRTENLSFYCKTCEMKTCIKEKNLTFCSECDEYPCQILIEFQKQLPHRLELFESLDYIRDNGVDKWVENMRANYSCVECGTINSPYEFNCRSCGHTPSSEFVKRNREQIVEMLNKNK